MLINPFCNKSSFPHCILPMLTSFPMFNRMAISAKNFQIFLIVVLLVSIYVMYDKCSFIRETASVTLRRPIFFYIFRETHHIVFRLSFNRMIRYSRALSRAETTFSALKSFSPHNNSPANLARTSLVTRQGTVQSFFVSDPQMTNPKQFSACQTVFLGIISHISAFSGAIDLLFPSCIMSRKSRLTNGARIHGEHYAST